MINLEILEAQSIYLAKKEFYDAVDRETKKTPEERALGEQDQAKTMSQPKQKSKNLLQKIFCKE